MMTRGLPFPAAVLLAVLCAMPACAQDNDEATLVAMLHEFLAGASRGDVTAHERFWADELVYTSSSGSRTDKHQIIEGMRASAGDRPAEPDVIYSARDIVVQLYDDTAVVAFRLVATPNGDDSQPAANYLNTGTFLKRDGAWRVIAWQATIAPVE